jgi:endonuclease/exonuclease/phosphatase family metal-dependent hydrolase
MRSIHGRGRGRGRGPGRAVVVLTLLLVATLASLGPPAAAPPADARPERLPAQQSEPRMVQQYNVCGAACAAPQPANAVNVAAFLYNADNALTISLNEICHFQYEQLVTATQPTGSVFVVARANVPNCPGTDKSFGNALLVRFATGVTGSASWTLSNPGRDCSNPSTECRAMACARGTTGLTSGVPVGACTSHFIHNDDALAQQQAAEYAFAGVSVTPPQRWLAGDFNLEPAQLPAVYAGAVNVGCSSAQCPTNPSIFPFNTIDYIFATPSSLHEPLDPACFSWASDHCFLRGRVAWTLD